MSMKNERQALLMITMAENLKKQNKMLKEAIKSAKHLIKRHQSDVDAFTLWLNPVSKAGHKNTLQRCLDTAKWELESKQNDVKNFKSQISDNNLIIRFITDSLKET